LIGNVTLKPLFTFFVLAGDLPMKQLIRIASAFFMALTLLAVVSCTSTPTQEGTGEYVDDSILTTKVNAAILAEPTLSSVEINVETFKGDVQLSGFVSSNADIAKAVKVAKDVIGVKSVKNDMRLR
jgi:osmotically-inducible protein OsmY